MKEERDIEKGYTTSEFVAKLRRLADALETGERFEIQIAGERIYVRHVRNATSSMSAMTNRKKLNSRSNGRMTDRPSNMARELQG